VGVTAANWIYWAPLGAASLHIVEEFVYPGGFAAWDRAYRPGIRSSITPRFHVLMNGLLLVACYDVVRLGQRPLGIAAWLTVMALLLSNAVWHVIGAVKTGSYSPGMLTGLLLYVPLAVYGYARFLRSGQSSLPTAFVAFAIGVSYHLWVAKAIHAWRARRVKV
jgi:hypothetical protein